MTGVDEPQDGLPPPHVDSLPGVSSGDVAPGDLHKPWGEAQVPGSGVAGVPDVLVAGVAVEIRGVAAQVVQEILGDWVDSQNRRIEFLKRDGGMRDGDTRQQIRRITYRVGLVYRVLRAWEGVLALPQENPKPDN